MATVYLGLGSNLGDRRKNIAKALTLIAEKVGDVIKVSGFHETEPWGFHSTSYFLNVAAIVETNLQPINLLHITQEIEKETGRREKSANGAYKDRIIDIDILFYDNQIIESPDLTIPHPLLHKRAFVLQPLVEIAPDFVHPVLERTVRELFCS
ncbi:MAG: 2-amino-4-hydroxy-6-hydroxymethyldihydropteridine diphosphokinase [Tannerella sp.]|jgi:2-amino-4-hydroxy-6-hydroxymethyldihydropteridine diphosphokinase|nr:2-amino-4-hydroxy-6-hydroxymethyldihydropteridine diphosphokinase [Tannerella sp.]